MRPAPIDVLIPADPAVEARLRGALEREARARLVQAFRSWGRLRHPVPPRDRTAAAPGSGPLRCWLAEVEDALAMARAAGACLKRPAGLRRGTAAWSLLVDRVADEGVLAALAPSGRLPATLPERALAEARRRLGDASRLWPAVRSRGVAPRAGAPPEVGRVLVERGVAVVEGRRDPRFAGRVGRALTTLDLAWPAGAGLVRGRVWRVVPVTAWATVSYSSPRKPGIAYIDVRSAPLVRLAEDLVHEATHMRIHELEFLSPLVTAPAREAGGREPRFYSPWRREWRPLRGLLHAVGTFTAGARFFERMLHASGPLGPLRLKQGRRRWLARRLLEERAAVAASLPLLRTAARRRLLTRAGARFCAAAAAEHAALAHRASASARWLRTTPAGRRELKALDRLVASLRSRPVRWSWREEPEERA